MKARTMTAVAIVLGMSVAPAVAQTPPVPQALQVPEGHELYLAGYAIGTQNYICMKVSNRWTWKFIGPQATLFAVRGTVLQQITTHFLGIDPAEGVTARPTWQHSDDSSRVWGRLRASSADPNYVEAGAIPWLLLEAAGSAAGPAGGDVMAQTKFIQRLNTSGGLAPAEGCSENGHNGTVALVPYTTDYFFYRAIQ